MFFSKKQDEQRILSAIRECLLQDSSHNGSALEKDDTSVFQDESALGKGDTSDDAHHAAAGIVPEPSIKPIERRETAQGRAIARDSPVTASNALAIDQITQPTNLLGSRDSPSIAPDASPINPNPRQSSSQQISSVRPSVTKRLFRTGIYGAVITVVVSAAFVWQSGDDTTKGMVIAWANSLGWSSPRLHNNLSPHSDSQTETASTSPDQPPQTKTAVILPAASASEPPPTSISTDSPPESSPDLKNQLETLTKDLDLVRQLVERIAARQDQITRDITTLQADEQSIRQRISGPASPAGRRRSRP